MTEDRGRAIGDASLNGAVLEPYLSGVLTDATIAELPNHSRGKVRESYDLADGRRIMIASDRLSAFDRILTTIPLKGQVLTQLARFWFDATREIAPNHVLEYPDPNVVIGRRLNIMPVEIVVRDYLAGTTSTSILSMYRAGHRHMYGIDFPDGLRPNQRLPATILTPTTKALAGAHDAPLSPAQIVAEGLLTADQWAEAEALALGLFRRGRDMVAARGLILVDTKYEFGFDPAGNLLVADEIHTPDSSRYWQRDSYESRFEAGTAPESFDKDFVRSWVVARCDPYRDAIPPIPDAVRVQAGQVYIDAYERITGSTLVLPDPAEPVLHRIRRNLAAYF